MTGQKRDWTAARFRRQMEGCARAMRAGSTLVHVHGRGAVPERLEAVMQRPEGVWPEATAPPVSDLTFPTDQ